MGVKHHGKWFCDVDGRWINLAHCDVIETASEAEGWLVRAWNALQPHVDAYVLWRGDDEAAAQAAADEIAKAAEGAGPQ